MGASRSDARLQRVLRSLFTNDRRRRLVWLVVIVVVTFCTVNIFASLKGVGQSLRDNLLQAFATPVIVESILHPRTPTNPPLVGRAIDIREPNKLLDNIIESTEFFAQHGFNSPGVHLRMKNMKLLNDVTRRSADPLLIVMVLNNHESWGRDRTVDDLFALLATFTHPPEQTSLAILTSSLDEFREIERCMRLHIHAYAQFALMFRTDFNVNDQLTRENRHHDSLQVERRRMIARYRNFAILSTLETWHQHVVWLDADVFEVPGGLVTKMIAAELDIIEPICYQGDKEYDLNAWVGQRKKRPLDPEKRRGFAPEDLHVLRMTDFIPGQDDFVPLDSVGGTMLYVRADVHRQGVLFPHHFVIGSEWEEEGYDGIETEGLCYEAHFLGYKCWGMPHDVIRHE